MKTSKFFRLTIFGDNLNLQEIKNKVNLPCKIFQKNEIITKTYVKQSISFKQKTNRWLFTDEQIDSDSVKKFLTKNLLIIKKHLNELSFFIENYKAKIELVVYADNKTDICLTKTQLKLLNELNVKFYISFC